MENDLISRSGLGIDYANPDVFNLTEYAKGWNNAVKIIKEAPAVAAVEVVRCKDCVYYEKHPYYVNECGNYAAMLHVYDDGFCSHGERRSDGT